MPKYANANSTSVDVEGFHLDPLETKETYQWLTVLPSGVTKVSDSPYFDPTILSQKISSTTTVNIPSTISGSFRIRIYVASGEVGVKINSSGAVDRLMGAGDIYSQLCVNRSIDSLIFTISTGVAYLTLEKS
jgi:hypothetical protein